MCVVVPRYLAKGTRCAPLLDTPGHGTIRHRAFMCQLIVSPINHSQVLEIDLSTCTEPCPNVWPFDYHQGVCRPWTRTMVSPMETSKGPSSPCAILTNRPPIGCRQRFVVENQSSIFFNSLNALVINYCIYNNWFMKADSQKRGRPCKPIKASETLPPIRVTPDQKKRFKEEAKKAGMSLSAWLKDVAHKQLSK